MLETSQVMLKVQLCLGVLASHAQSLSFSPRPRIKLNSFLHECPQDECGTMKIYDLQHKNIGFA